MKSYMLDYLKEMLFPNGDFNCSVEDFAKFCELAFSGLSSKSKIIIEMRALHQSRSTIAKKLKCTTYRVEKSEKSALQFMRSCIKNSIQNNKLAIEKQNRLNDLKALEKEILEMMPSIVEEILAEDSYHPSVENKMKTNPEELADHFRFHFGKLTREKILNIAPDAFEERVVNSMKYLRYCQKRIINSNTADIRSKECATIQYDLSKAEERASLKIFERIKMRL